MGEFLERPTLRAWKKHQRDLRWERRLARAPYYRLYLLSLLLIAIALLLWGTLALTPAPTVG